MITQKTIDEIFSTAQIEEVVSDFVQLKRRGSNQLGLCPFHNEKTPSFTVSPTKNIYKCFGCGRGGNTVQFVMEHEQMSYPEALRYLADKYDIKVEETQRSAEEIEQQGERESMMIVNKNALTFFKNNLFETDRGKSIGLSYFKKRGYPEHIIESFELGFAPEDGRGWTTWAQTNGINLSLSKNLGLTTDKGFDFFRGRVMFPIHSVAGKVIAFAGRSLSNDKRSPKYINSPETLIYDKSRVLYGLHLAKRQIVKDQECILVEGYTDVISMHMQGIENVVASSGTSLTEGQIRLIKRFCNQVLILYDGDAAGQKAAMRGVDLLLKQDVNVRIVILPEGQDPDSFIQSEGVNGFKEFVEEYAQDFILFKSAALLEDVKRDPIRKTVVVKDIMQSIALIPDTLKRSMYIKEVSERFSLEESILLDTLGGFLKKQAKEFKRSNERKIVNEEAPILQRVKEEESVKTDIYQEKDILRILIGLGHNPFSPSEDFTVGEYILTNLQDILDKDIFDLPLFQKACTEYAHMLNVNGKVSPSDFTQHKDGELSKIAVDLLSEKYSYSENWAKRHDIYLNTQETPELNFASDCKSSLLRLKMRKLNRLIEQNKQKMAGSSETPPLDGDELNIALEVHARYLHMRNEIAHGLNQVVL